MAINGSGADDAYELIHGRGDVEHVSVRDLHVAGHRTVRLFPGDGYVRRNIEVANVVARELVTRNTVEVSATYTDELPENDDVREVRLWNIYSKAAIRSFISTRWRRRSGSTGYR